MNNVDWYRRKLAAVEPTPAPVQHPSTQPAPTVNNPQIVRLELPDPNLQRHSTPTCPQCGSANYGAPSPRIAPRCFECGYGLAIQNSTQGMSATGGGPVTPAVQVPTAGYQPTTIIGRVD